MTRTEPILHQRIAQAIHRDWHFEPSEPDQHDHAVNAHVQRKKTIWRISEPASSHDLLVIHAHDSIAFSLDQKGKTPFPFLGKALAGMHTVADCILVTQYKNTEYILIIEMKANPGHGARPKAIKQIQASARLMEWLCKTLSALDHWRGEPVYLGVISYLPREQARKGTSVREAPPKVPLPDEQDCDFPIWELRNRERLDVPLLLEDWLAFVESAQSVE